MDDRELVLDIPMQLQKAADTILKRSEVIKCTADYTDISIEI